MKVDQNALKDIDIALKADDHFILSRVLDAHPEFARPEYESSIAPYMKKAFGVNPALGKMMIEHGVSAQLAGPENAAQIAKMFGGKVPNQKEVHPESAQKIADLQMAMRKDDEIISSRILDSAPWLANKEFAPQMDKVMLGAFKNGNSAMVHDFASLGIQGNTFSPEDLHSLKGNKLAMEHFGKLTKDAKTPQEREIRQLQMALIDPATSDSTLAAIHQQEELERNPPTPPAPPTVELPAPVSSVDTNVTEAANSVVSDIQAGKGAVAGTGPSKAAIAGRVNKKHSAPAPKKDVGPAIP